MTILVRLYLTQEILRCSQDICDIFKQKYLSADEEEHTYVASGNTL